MFVRISHVQGDPARLDDLITFVRSVVKPATDELDGNNGLGMWVNRDSGDALVMTVWRDEASLRGSEKAVEKLRDDGAGIVGGTAAVERYETVILEGTEPHQLGFCMRLIRMHSHNPGRLDADADWARQVVLPALRMQYGFVSYAAGVDRGTGAVATMSTFRDPLSAASALVATEPIRGAATSRGITIDNITEFEVALVGIRVPMPGVVPEQRTIDVTERERAGAPGGRRA